MDVYKLGLVSDTWTDQVKTRAVREVLTVARLARLEGLQLIVGANVDLKALLGGIFDITIAEDMMGCDTYRVYIDYENRVASDSDVADPLAVLDRLPEDADYELVELNKGKPLPGLVIDKDPYGGCLPENKDIQIIQPIIDLNRPPPPAVRNPEDYLY
jgi:hypothetical protein